MKNIPKKERVIIAILLVISQVGGWILSSFAHPILALPVFAISFFLAFIWIPIKTGEFSESNQSTKRKE
ncbi:MAG: hypothetical protein WCJ33_00060 [Pseudomonadota bacterium]